MNDWSAFPVGTRVRCTDPDQFIADKARRLTGRTGTVVRHQAFSGAPIIQFDKIGRRLPYTWVPGRPSDLEIVP